MNGLVSILSSFWLPPEASKMAAEVDWLLWFVLWISIFFFFLVTGLVTVFVIKYRYREGDDDTEHKLNAGHATALEITWTLVPVVVVILIFYYGFMTWVHMDVAPANSYDINVTGRMWTWAFTYPNGVVDDQLHIPVNQPVRLILSSDDVIHSLFIPAFRLKKDVVPGRYNHFWVTADKPGKYIIYCAQYCGLYHTTMHSHAIVQSRADFEQWLEQAADWSKGPNALTPVAAGKMLYEKRGCVQCHTVDGTKLIGPSWKGIYGHKVTFKDGTSTTVDDNYIHESIIDPGKQIVAGYDNVMPSFAGAFKDQDINAIIAYIKSLSPGHEGDKLQGVKMENGSQKTEDRK
jgi:cytochrome c oxidase subunit 2